MKDKEEGEGGQKYRSRSVVEASEGEGRRDRERTVKEDGEGRIISSEK